jgi:hypothetical protein
MTSSKGLTVTVHTIIRTTIGPYDVNQAINHVAAGFWLLKPIF